MTGKRRERSIHINEAHALANRAIDEHIAGQKPTTRAAESMRKATEARADLPDAGRIALAAAEWHKALKEEPEPDWQLWAIRVIGEILQGKGPR